MGSLGDNELDNSPPTFDTRVDLSWEVSAGGSLEWGGIGAWNGTGENVIWRHVVNTEIATGNKKISVKIRLFSLLQVNK